MKKTLIYGSCIKIPIKKNVPWHIPAPSAVACDIFLLRASAHPSRRVFYAIGNFFEIPYCIKKTPFPPPGF